MPEVSGASWRSGPRLRSGAFVATGERESNPVSVPFRYNPSSLRRSMTPQMVKGGWDEGSEVVRFSGAPIETIAIEIEIEIDDGEQSSPMALKSGIAPLLAALELLAYPTSSAVQRRQHLLSSGTLEISPMEAPNVRFVWEPERSLSVRIATISITEQEFDQNLNPVRATIEVMMRVPTSPDVASDVDGYTEFLAFQETLEQEAAMRRPEMEGDDDTPGCSGIGDGSE